MFHLIKKSIIALASLFIVLFAVNLVLGFTEPSAPPPSGNVDGLISTNSSAQTKIGDFQVTSGGLRQTSVDKAFGGSAVFNTSNLSPNGLIANSGKVGIGTDHPLAALHIISNTTPLLIQNSTQTLFSVNKDTGAITGAPGGINANGDIAAAGVLKSANQPGYSGTVRFGNWRDCGNTYWNFTFTGGLLTAASQASTADCPPPPSPSGSGIK